MEETEPVGRGHPYRVDRSKHETDEGFWAEVAQEQAVCRAVLEKWCTDHGKPMAKFVVSPPICGAHLEGADPHTYYGHVTVYFSDDR